MFADRMLALCSLVLALSVSVQAHQVLIHIEPTERGRNAFSIPDRKQGYDDFLVLQDDDGILKTGHNGQEITPFKFRHMNPQGTASVSTCTLSGRVTDAAVTDIVFLFSDSADFLHPIGDTHGLTITCIDPPNIPIARLPLREPQRILIKRNDPATQVALMPVNAPAGITPVEEILFTNSPWGWTTVHDGRMGFFNMTGHPNQPKTDYTEKGLISCFIGGILDPDVQLATWTINDDKKSYLNPCGNNGGVTITCDTENQYDGGGPSCPKNRPRPELVKY